MDMEFASTPDYALAYYELGFQVVPAAEPRDGKSWKRPVIKWRGLEGQQVDKSQFDEWYGPSGEHLRRQNLGIICGKCSGGVFIVDLDLHKNQQAQGWWQSMLDRQETAGELEAPYQTTGGGGLQFLFRAPPHWTPPTIKTSIGVDIRGQGGFAMLPPSLHESGKRYEWAEGYEPWLFETPIAPDWFCKEIDILAKQFGGAIEGTTGIKTSTPATVTNEFGRIIDGREELAAKIVWARVVDLYRDAPIRPSQSMIEDQIAETFDIYERRVKSRLPRDPESTNATLLEREGRGISMFRQKWSHAIEQWDHKVREHANVPKPAGASQSAVEALRTADAPVEAHPGEMAPVTILDDLDIISPFPLDITKIPPRDWLVPGLLMRKHLSMLVAPGGSGKSQLMIQVAIMCAMGIPWAGWEPRRKEKVLLINGEDDFDEMSRRLYAACEGMEIPSEELSGRIFLPHDLGDMVVAQADPKTKKVHTTPLFERLRNVVRKHDIGILIVDPFTETFVGSESLNDEVKWAGVAWREMARTTNASVMVVHHTRKYAGQMAGDADASRGGGSLVNTSRIVSTLFTMTPEDAERLGVEEEERSRYARFDDAKANLTLITGAAKWFQKKGIKIPNGVGEMPDDEIGVLLPWNPPGAFDGVSSNAINLCLDRIRDGVPSPNGQSTDYFTFSKASLARYVGKVVSEVLGVEQNRADKIIGAWKKAGLLVEDIYFDPSRKKEFKVVRVVDGKRPGRAA